MGSAEAEVVIVPRQTLVLLAGRATSAPRVSRPQALASLQLAVTPRLKLALIPTAGVKELYVKLPVS